MNQAQKDEETKRRVSASMTNGSFLPTAKVERAPRTTAPPMALVVRPQSSRQVTKETTAPVKPSLTQEERDAEAKRRVSATMSALPADMMVTKRNGTKEPTPPPSPRVTVGTTPPPSPPVTGPLVARPISSAESSPVLSRASSPVIPFPKARSPSRSPVVLGAGTAGANTTRRSSTPYMPTVASISAGSPRRVHNINNKLPPKHTGMATTNKPHLRLGDKKQRVSLPPSLGLGGGSPASSPNRQPVLTAAVTAASPVRNHRLGDNKKKQRVSLPPSLPLGGSSPAASPQRRTSTVAAVSPGKHRMGDKKKRVSLPPSFALTNSPAASPLRKSTTAAASPGRHRLGDKKQRVSLPPSFALPDIPSTFSLPVDVGISEESAMDAPTHQAPRKGLRNNTRQSIANQVIAGPGAYSVPFAMLPTDNDDEDDEEENRNNDGEEAKEPETCDEEEIAIGANSISGRRTSVMEAYDRKYAEVYGDVETGLRTSSTGDTSTGQETGSIASSRARGSAIDDHRHASTGTLANQSPQRRRSTVMSQRALEDQGGKLEGDENSTCYSRLKAGCWCNVIVPLFLAAAVIAGATTFALALKKGGNDDPSPPPTANTTVSTATIDIFADVAVPSFTLAAWENPSSPQAKAKKWLEEDPSVGTYTPDRKLQRFALATLYHSTGGGRWKNSTGWLSSKHECLWFSARVPPMEVIMSIGRKAGNTTPPAKTIACNSDLIYEYLVLSADSLRGTVPPEVSLLSSLVEINFESNTLFESIPSELGLLTKLTSLTLSNNDFDSTLPETLADLGDSLVHFHAEKNSITGTLPSWLGNMNQLNTLVLGENNLVGTIPTEIGLCQKLSRMTIADNQVTGTLPSEIGNLPLIFLGVAFNRLDSTIPSELTNLGSLETFFARQAGLRGTIPTTISSLTSLLVLAIGANNLVGTVPSEVGMLSTLKALYLDTNRFTDSTIPSEIGKLSRLSTFHVYMNKFNNSPLPSEFGLLTAMTDLRLHGTQIAGSIPTELAALSKLKTLNIKDTAMTGSFAVETCALVTAGNLTLTADCGEVICCEGQPVPVSP